MSRIRILHTTCYNYTETVKFGPHRLIVRPREGHDLQVEKQLISIQPPALISWSRDLFGNSIALATFQEGSDTLEIINEVIVARKDSSEQQIPAGLQKTPYPVIYSELEIPVATGYLEPVYREEAVIREWTSSTFLKTSPPDAGDLAREIMDWVHNSIQYRRREDRGVQTPSETLRLMSGSCRDMATLLLEAFRSVGIAARFASGYLDCDASAAGRAATHAWTEAYLPGEGWMGYDPTLGECTSQKHIVTGVSSHPRGVMPISGIYSGNQETYLGMTVAVTIEKLAEASVPNFGDLPI